MGLRTPNMPFVPQTDEELAISQDYVAQLLKQQNQPQDDLAKMLQQQLTMPGSSSGSVEQPPITAQDIDPQQMIPEQGRSPASAMERTVTRGGGNKNLQAMLEEQLAQGMSRRENDLETQRAMFAKRLEQTAQPDLSGFYEMARAGGAKDAGAGYKAPQNYDPSTYAEAITKNEGGLTDDQINYLKAQLEAQAKAASASGTNERFQFAKELDTRSKIANSDEAKKIKANLDLIDKISEYKNVFKKIGSKASLTGEEKAELDSAQATAAIAWKEAANLGALQGPDMGLIDQSIGKSPTTGNALLGYEIAGGAEGLNKKIDTALRASEKAARNNQRTIKKVYPYKSVQDIHDYYESEINNRFKDSKKDSDKSLEVQNKMDRLRELENK